MDRLIRRSTAYSTLSIQRSIVLRRHPITVVVEEPFWQTIRAAAAAHGMRLSELLERIDQERGKANLSSALRVFALLYVKGLIPPEVWDRP